MELPWFFYSITATILLGVSMAFYKMPFAKNSDRFATTFWSMAISVPLAYAFFYNHLSQTTTAMLLFALCWGLSFTSLALLQMWALTKVDTNALFPVTTIASLVATVTIGLVFFQSHISFVQAVGMALAIGTIALFIYKGGKLQYSPLVIGIGSSAVFFSVCNKIIQKLVADGTDIFAFQIYQYVFATFFALCAYFIAHRKNWKSHVFSGSFGIGATIGVLGFFGGFSLMVALTKGPFPLITSIHSLYIFVTALTAFFLFKEKLTTKKIILLCLAIVAVILIKVG